MEKLILSGREAVLKALDRIPKHTTRQGILIFPDESCTLKMRFMTDLSAVPAFFPATPEEAFQMALSGSRYSATYRTPVLIHMDKEVSEGLSVIPLEKKKRFPEERTVSPAERTLPSAAFSDSGWNTVTGKGNRCILTGGSLWAAVSDILNGYPEFRVIKIGTSNPFPEEAVLRYLKGVTDVMVMDGEHSRFLPDVYMLKGKYDLKFAVHPFSAYGRELSDLSDFVADMIPLSDRRILVRAKPVAERSVFSLPILPDRRGEKAEAGMECQMSLSAG